MLRIRVKAYKVQVGGCDIDLELEEEYPTTKKAIESVRSIADEVVSRINSMNHPN